MTDRSADLSAGYTAYREFVNPLVAVRAELFGEPYQLVRVSNGLLVDVDGRVLDDFLSGWGTQAFGHRPAVIERALRDFLDGDTPSFYPSSVSPYAGLLARALCERAGGGYGAAYFASGGTEAVEAAIKLARAATGRPSILCLEGAYHGCTLGSVAMMEKGPYRDPFAPHVPRVRPLPFGDTAALAAALAEGDVAAVVVEPIQVESGVRALPPAYIAALCELTRESGALLVADEIQTGLGRTGRFLASEVWPCRPEVVVLGKSLGGGLMPISAILTTRAVWDRAYGTHELSESHVSTFSGNALACVAALAALSQTTDALCARVAEVGARFRQNLEARLKGLSLVKEVRGDGLLVGIALSSSDHPWLSFSYLGADWIGDRSAVGVYLVHRLFKAGFGAGVGAHDWTTLRVQPPLIIGEDRLDAFAAACEREVRYLCELT